MKTIVFNIFVSLLCCLTCVYQVSAQSTLSGQWSCTLSLNSEPIGEGLWTLKQFGPSLTGAGSSGTTTWTSVGSIIDSEFVKADTYNGGDGYILVLIGTVNEISSEITGTWSDTLVNSGTFIAQRLTPIEFSPQTQIEDAPAILITSKNITVTMEKFSKALPKGTRNALIVLLAATREIQSTRKTQPKLTIKYEVTVKGATRQQTRAKVTSKRNEVTIKKLVPGNYITTYRVQAFQGEKRVYQSNVSPAASFTIR